MNTEQRRALPDVTPQACDCGCAEEPAGDNPVQVPSYVYALGRVEARFPSLAYEKEYAQVVGSIAAEGQTDRQLFRSVMSDRKNRYLARRLCWVLSTHGLETYLLQPRDPLDLDLLVESLRPLPDPSAIDAVIGLRGSIAPPELCNGLMLPIVAFDHIYSFDR